MTRFPSIPGVLLVVANTLAQTATPLDPAPTDDFSPLLFVMFLAALAVCLVLLGIGVVLALVGVACTVMLIALGLVSSSVVFALLRRRVSAGVRAFHYQTCGVLAAPAGVTLLWFTSASFGLQMTWRSVLLFGAGAGYAAGLLIAGTFDWAARLTCHRLLRTPGAKATPAIPLPDQG